MLDSVASRAEVLSRRYYFLEKEDLMQEGYILLMDLEKKSLGDLQVYKAINNMFSNLERHAQYQQKIEKNISSFEVEPDEISERESLDSLIEREELTRKLLEKLSKQETVMVEWLVEGWSLDKIAKAMKISRDRVRRIVNHIIKVRKEIEEE